MVFVTVLSRRGEICDAIQGQRSGVDDEKKDAMPRGDVEECNRGCSNLLHRFDC